MPRIKRGKSHLKKRNKLLKETKGYRGGRKSKIKLAKTAVRKAGVYAYRDRRTKKREARALWQIKINAGCRVNDFVYSRFIDSLKKNKIELLISGTKATVEWSLDTHSNVTVGYRDKPSKVIPKDHLMMKNVSGMFDYPAGHTEGYPDAFKQVFKQIYSNVEKPSYASFYDGYRQMVINEKIYESAKLESWVSIND